jgi:hypothetical protein
MIPDRKDFCKVAAENNYNTAVEIGVWHGDFAKHNLNHYKGVYYCVDPYKHIESNGNDKNFKNETINNNNFNICKNNLKIFGDRVKLIRKESLVACDMFENEFFDWIYIDASHTYENVMNDLNHWYPKLKKGGLFSGDDYGSQNIKYLNDERWKNNKQLNKFYSFVKTHNFGVGDAVNDFCKQKNIDVYITWFNDSGTPNWYFFK